MTNFITTVLSSAVIAAVIGFFSAAKSNQLKYVTSERGKWRKEIKRIASGLAECKENNKKSKKLLTKLKLQINAYGYKDTYSCDILLNCFTDEHIWKEIKEIENGKEYVHHRERLLKYLQLLLKFDWERSKREAKTEEKTIVMVIIYLLLVISNTIVDGTLSKVADVIWEEKQNILFQLVPLFVLMIPYFMEYVGILRREENYSSISNIYLFLLAEVILAIYWVFCSKNNILGFEKVAFLCGEMFLIVLLFGQDISRKQLYVKYSSAVRKCFDDSHLRVSYPYSVIGTLFVMTCIENIFSKLCIGFDVGDSTELLSEEECNEAIKLRYRFVYIWKMATEDSITAKKYLLDNPKACKTIVKWNDKKIILGFRPNEWKSLANEIVKESKQRS